MEDRRSIELYSISKIDGKNRAWHGVGWGKKTKTVARGRDVMCNRLVRYHDGGKPVATVLHQRMHAGC